MRPIWIVAALAAVSFAQSAHADDLIALGRDCAAANSQDAVDACTKLINGGTLQAKYLAVAYSDRGLAYSKLGDDPHASVDFMFAASHGDGAAAYYLAGAYYDGKGVERDAKKALIWYLAADKKGVKQAANEVAYQYDHGIGVEQNDAEAFKWYKKGTDEGQPWPKKTWRSSMKTAAGRPRTSRKRSITINLPLRQAYRAPTTTWASSILTGPTSPRIEFLLGDIHFV